MGNNGKLRKRIAAIASSILLLFSKASANMLNSPAEEVQPKITTEQAIDDSSNFSQVANSYRDFKQIGQDIIPIEDIVMTSIPECDTMTPQGLAIMDNYMLVTAYDAIEGYKKELKFHSYNKNYAEKLKQKETLKTHNSVIYVIDINNKDLVSIIELPDKNHVGGIAIDDENAYIAKSSDQQISVISLDKIRHAIANSQDTNYAQIDYDNNLDCGCDASFVTIRNTGDKNQLVVGTWNPLPASSSINIFNIQNDNSLELTQKFKTNSSANGALFVKRDDKEYFLVSSSIGKYLDSKLFVYEVEDNDGKLFFNERSKFILPPMSEEIAEYTDEQGNRKLAIGSEIFSTRYEINRQPVYPNGIMITDLNSILNKKEKRHDAFLDIGLKDIVDEDTIKKEEESPKKDDDLEK